MVGQEKRRWWNEYRNNAGFNLLDKKTNTCENDADGSAALGGLRVYALSSTDATWRTATTSCM